MKSFRNQMMNAMILVIVCCCMPLIAQDSLKININPDQKTSKPLMQKMPFSNYLIFDLAFGLGFGSGTDIGYGNKSTGFSFYAQMFEFAYGFSDLNNIGIGTSVYETWAGSTVKEDGKNGLKSAGMPASWFPVYLYYPISFEETISTYGRASSRMLSPILYVQAGGSLWGSQSNYYHIGAVMQWSWLMQGSTRMAVPYIAGIHVGIYHTPEYSSHGIDFGSKTGYYVSFRFGMGGVIPKRKK